MGIMNYSRGEIQAGVRRGEITICVVGLGRVGLPTASVFAKSGARVEGADINEELVRSVNSGKCHLLDEPGLSELVRDCVKKGKLKATAHISKAVNGSDAIIICVPTPVDEQKVPDYSIVEKVCREMAKTLKKGSLVIVESTVGPGTVEDMVIPVLEEGTGLKVSRDFGVASCPERGDPGRMLENLYSVPRVVGGVSTRSTNVASWLYNIALKVKVVKVRNPKTANAVKLTENLFRDVNIALVNEFALLYERLDIDTIEVIDACATKYNFMPHYPGAGVGGPCLPQNPYYLIIEGVKVGNIPYLVRLAREINDRMPEHVISMVTEALNEAGKTVKGSKIAVLGVAYKPNVHDIQLSPMEKIVRKLMDMGGDISIYDPMFKNERVFGIKVADTLRNAVNGVDCIVIGTAHKEFSNLDWAALHQMCRRPVALVDAPHLIEPEVAEKNGFIFMGIGRKSNAARLESTHGS